MGVLPSKVQERLDQLARKFSQDLPRRLEGIRVLIRQAEDGDTESLRELRLRTHKLAGSAATFGFEALTERARVAQRLVERDLSAQPPILGDETRAALDTVVSEYLERPRSETTVARDLSPALTRPVATASAKLVFQIGEIPGLTGEFSEQFAVFGLQLVQITTLDGLEEYLEERATPSDAETRMIVLLATVQFFREKTARLKQLASLRVTLSGALVTVLVGGEDDFETRLRSVRFGAQAFLSAPVDAARLVDRIEMMVGEEAVLPYHVLVVDDDPEQVSATALILQEAGMITSVVTDPKSIFQVLVDYKPELILMDMYMPECNGAELAAIIRQNSNFVGIPILFLSVETDVKKQLDAIQSGADGFLTKPIDPNHLVASVRTRAARTRAMRFYMERDSLTGLLNHTNLKQRLEHEIHRSRRIGTELAFAMIDIDRFKSVNDSHGHLTGDRVLKSLANLLEERLRRTDVVGRYGGEEFGVILFNTSVEQAREIMDGIRESFSRLKQHSGKAEFFVTFSGGIAGYPGVENGSALSEAADGALYNAKQAGRNRIMLARR